MQNLRLLLNLQSIFVSIPIISRATLNSKNQYTVKFESIKLILWLFKFWKNLEKAVFVLFTIGNCFFFFYHTFLGLRPRTDPCSYHREIVCTDGDTRIINPRDIDQTLPKNDPVPPSFPSLYSIREIVRPRSERPPFVAILRRRNNTPRWNRLVFRLPEITRLSAGHTRSRRQNPRGLKRGSGVYLFFFFALCARVYTCVPFSENLIETRPILVHPMDIKSRRLAFLFYGRTRRKKK